MVKQGAAFLTMIQLSSFVVRFVMCSGAEKLSSDEQVFAVDDEPQPLKPGTIKYALIGGYSAQIGVSIYAAEATIWGRTLDTR